MAFAQHVLHLLLVTPGVYTIHRLIQKFMNKNSIQNVIQKFETATNIQVFYIKNYCSNGL